jgi:flagellar hook assembly protein FlgD
VQHRSSATIEFQVVTAPPLRVVRTFAFPNPIRSGGRGSGGVIVVDAPGDSVNVLIRVYSIAGRLVRVLRQMGGIGQVQVTWDGLDAEGDPLAQGTYLYKVYVGIREADGRTSPRQNATAEGRFVVLNP